VYVFVTGTIQTSHGKLHLQYQVKVASNGMSFMPSSMKTRVFFTSQLCWT